MEFHTPTMSTSSSTCADRSSVPFHPMRSSIPMEDMTMDIPQELLLPLWTESGSEKRFKFQFRFRPTVLEQDTQKKMKLDTTPRIDVAESYLNQRFLESEEDMDLPVSFKEKDSWIDSLQASPSRIMRPKVIRRWIQGVDRKTIIEPTNSVDHVRPIV